MTANNLLPPEILHLVLWRLENPIDLARCAQVCRSWYSAACSQSLWQQACLRFWVPPPPPQSSERENTKEREKEKFVRWTGLSADQQRMARLAFRNWHLQFRHYHAIYPQVKEVAFRLSNWLRARTPSTLMTLLPGRSDWAKVRERFESFSKHENLRHLALFYHFFDGQKPRMPHVDSGLFGTYNCYGQYTSLFMLPSNYTKVEKIHNLNVLVFAVCPRSGKFLSIVLEAPSNPEIMLHVVEIDVHRLSYLSRGTFFSWISNYVRDLEEGVYDVNEPEGAISIFPNYGSFSSSCVTNGIEVTVSSLAQLESGQLNGVWAYRVKICYVGGSALHSKCQFYTRNWYIRYKSGYEEHVQGEAVVGQFPELSYRSPVFTYCSVCTGKTLLNGSTGEKEYDPVVMMHGYFTFIPGTIIEPMGEPFTVTVAPFMFEQPISLDPSRPFSYTAEPRLDWD